MTSSADEIEFIVAKIVFYREKSVSNVTRSELYVNTTQPMAGRVLQHSQEVLQSAISRRHENYDVIINCANTS